MQAQHTIMNIKYCNLRINTENKVVVMFELYRETTNKTGFGQFLTAFPFSANILAFSIFFTLFVAVVANFAV